ncbi:hypothetical protein P3X46_031183 [Hevea brasiliensis]|uniref:Presenilin n=1 Tax=Hevea brasiliensis TaxID=3981 RepID=A0ABQ9KMM5_HEVBR|nr:hypothetical protein P3X46_031183 [Hevea brasiliensis]
MAQIQRPKSIIDSIGEEIIKILTPVSICMFIVVILVSILNADSSSASTTINTIATMPYTGTTSDSFWDKLKGALLNSFFFVAIVPVVTFDLVLLFYLRCTQFLKLYMDFSIPIDCFTFLVALFKFAVVGVLAVFMPKMAIFVKQVYLVVVGVLVAYWFTLLPEWTTWVLLVAMALYDLAAVLLPVGPLRLLFELAISRDEDVPALVYEARPVTNHDSGSGTVRNLGNGSQENLNFASVLDSSLTIGTVDVGHQTTRLVRAEEGQVMERNAELSAPLIDHRGGVQLHGQGDTVLSESLLLEDIGLGSTGAIKLGLGDFVFYSVLVGRAAMYDFMTAYACYLAIIAALGITLMLLAFYEKALPALPVSIVLGVLFYFLTRLLLEAFVVKCSLSLVMF